MKMLVVVCEACLPAAGSCFSVDQLCSYNNDEVNSQ